MAAQETQDSVSSDGRGQRILSSAYLQEFQLKLTGCVTNGDLLKLLPVPVQPVSRDILDGVYQGSLKLGAAEALLQVWKDKLQSGALGPKDGIAQLNSIRVPAVQVCKEALQSDDGALSSMSLDNTIFDAKKMALTKMIEIKDREVKNLQAFIQPTSIKNRIESAWEAVVESQTAAITPEHAALLRNGEVAKKICQIAASIGDSASQRARITKEKRVTVKKGADVDMTDAYSGDSKKQLASVIEEVLKRREQSRRDRTLSGKGKRRNGTSKKKTQQDTSGKKRRGPTKNKGARETRRLQERR